MTLGRRIAATVPSLAFVLAAPLAIVEAILAGPGAGVAAAALGIAVAFALAPLVALLERLAPRLGRARALPLAGLEILIFGASMGTTRRTHPGVYAAALALFAGGALALPALVAWRRRAGAWSVLGVALVALLAVDVALPGSLYLDLHDAAGLAMLAILVAATAPRRQVARPRPLLLAGLALGAALILAGIDRFAPSWRAAASLRGRHADRLQRALRAVVDLDGDDHSPIAWGRDCDDLDGDRHPLADDPPGGGDANCDGVDPPAAPSDEQRGLAPPAGEPALPRGAVDLVLLVTVDTLRADHLTSERMPRLVALARRGLSFTRAYAAGARTRLSLPAVAGPLRALPAGEGVALIGGEAPRRIAALPGPPLAADDARALTDAALAALGSPTPPRLLWVHYFEPHRSGGSRAAYARAVAGVDEQLGRLVDFLETSGRLPRTVVLVSSDHGEGFGEHGAWFHGVSGYDEMLRVPLVLVAPGLAPGSYAGLVTLHDVAPTILGALAHPPGEGRGRSLLRLRTAPNAPLHRFVAAASARAAAGEELQQPLYVLVEEQLKLTWCPEDGVLELYDLAADPEERHDLAASRPGDAERLRQKLALWRDLRD